MFFFIMETAKNLTPEDSRRTVAEKAADIRQRTGAYNRNHGEEGYFFMAPAEQGSLTAGLITENSEADFGPFLKAVELEPRGGRAVEITCERLVGLLNRAQKTGFIDDISTVIHRMHLDTLGHRCIEGTLREELAEYTTREQAEAVAEKNYMRETYLPEIDRIFAGKAVPEAIGHPVHYVIETDDPVIREKVCVSLLEILYKNKRIASRRFSMIDMGCKKEFSSVEVDQLYEIARGGSMVLMFRDDTDEDDDMPARRSGDSTARFCKAARKYRNNVLTVFCLPRNCAGLKMEIFEKLGDMQMVELSEELIQGERARDTLRKLAGDTGVAPDDTLYAMIEENKTYLAPDLSTLFDKWYNQKLRNTIYPQYENMTFAGEAAAQAEPQGSAYEELDKMVGLREAKKVIKKAINYYKVQKLLKEKGFKQDHPSMHMVFTGSPGTAKTTVARLFARIMRENGILATGKLVEVGRADLVGKYVGWTAQTVRDKFKEARGGVLFIDEAYSLVDDRSNSYGDEAINTIVQEMENNREDMVVIFAGYPKPMEEFLQKNPGLRSRIAFQVPFDDYNTEELCDIARLRSSEIGFHLTQKAMEKLAAIFENARSQEGFGNGRYVRKVLENAKMNWASRLLEMDFDTITEETMETLLPEDIEAPYTSAPPRKKNPIGFTFHDPESSDT